MTLKITIIQGAFLPVPPKLGGAVEKRWFALSKKFAQKGHKVLHISRDFSDMPAEELIEGVLHKRVRGYNTPSSGIFLKWLDLLYSLRAKAVVPPDSDVVVTNTFWAPILLPSSLRKRCMVDVGRLPKKQMLLYKQASRLKANSTPVAKAIKKELPVNQHHRVVIIPNPLPFQDLPDVDCKAKKPILLYVGRVHPEKGLELLIEAFKKIGSGWQLQIVGPAEINAGGGGPSYLESLKFIAGEGNVEFIGAVYNMELLNKYYADASIFIYPSLAEKGETFGLAPLEAMAWGCVPVVSNLACFRDFIKHGKNGLVFDHRCEKAIGSLSNAIERLLKGTSFRQSLAQEAIKVRQSHSTYFIASLFLEEFERIISENNINNPPH